jgi:hypothetical protein
MNNYLLFGIFFSLFPIGFVCMTTGYFLLVRHVWYRPDKKEQLKLIFTSKKHEEWSGRPRAARTLVLIGALCGAVGSFGLLACTLF